MKLTTAEHPPTGRDPHPSLTINAIFTSLNDYYSFSSELLRVMLEWAMRFASQNKVISVIVTFEDKPSMEETLQALEKPYLGDELYKHRIKPFTLNITIPFPKKVIVLMLNDKGEKKRINIKV